MHEKLRHSVDQVKPWISQDRNFTSRSDCTLLENWIQSQDTPSFLQGRTDRLFRKNWVG